MFPQNSTENGSCLVQITPEIDVIITIPISTGCIKKVDPFGFKLATTYCINLTPRINECVKTQGWRLHMEN